MWPENRFFHSEGSDPYLAPLGTLGGQGRVFFHWSQHFSIEKYVFKKKRGGGGENFTSQNVCLAQSYPVKGLGVTPELNFKDSECKHEVLELLGAKNPKRNQNCSKSDYFWEVFYLQHPLNLMVASTTLRIESRGSPLTFRYPWVTWMQTFSWNTKNFVRLLAIFSPKCAQVAFCKPINSLLCILNA